MTTKPQTIVALAKAIAKEAQAAAPILTAAADKALNEKTEAHEAFCRLEAAHLAARHAKALNDHRAEVAAALARLAAYPDLIDALLSGDPSDDQRAALIRRGLMLAFKGGWIRRSAPYHLTGLGRDVAALARGLRDRLAASE